MTERLRYGGPVTTATTTRPAKNATVYNQICNWAARIPGPVPAPLEGVTWDQSAWFTLRTDGTRTCCAAGAAVLLHGGIPANPHPEFTNAPGQFARYSACLMPGDVQPRSVPVVAAQILGLDHQEAAVLFSPLRSLAVLAAARRAFAEDIPVTRELVGAGWEWDEAMGLAAMSGIYGAQMPAGPSW